MRRILVLMAFAAIGLAPMPATAGSPHHCFGEVPTVVGTHGDDSLSGDVVVGRGGTDAISGRLVCGNSGDDYGLVGYMVNGGPGHDWGLFVQGPIGIGGSGNDYMRDGSYDGQTFYGGDGDGEMDLQDDFGPGSEGMHVEPDVFYGGTGNDRSSATAMFQDSRQYGQEGNDQLTGGNGLDELFGGPGDDLLRSSFATRNDNITDLLRGGEGFDTCLLREGDKAISCEDVTVLDST